MLAAPLFLLMLQGCPDPTTASDLGHGPAGASGANAPGPSPDVPLGPPPEPGSFEVTPGEGVLISGTVVYNGSRTGVFRVDFLQKEDGIPPSLAHMLTMDAPGAFQVEAPKGTGTVYIVGFVDEAGDGPSLSDPGGMIADPIEVDEDPVSDLVLELTDAPDLGDFTPGEQWVKPEDDLAAEATPEDGAEGAEAEDADAPEQEAPADDAQDQALPADDVPAEAEAPEEVPASDEPPAEDAAAEPSPDTPEDAPSE